MTTQEKIDFLLELIRCSYHMDYWHYNAEGMLISSTSAAERMLDTVLHSRDFFSYLENSPVRVPVILAAKKDVRWIAVQQTEGEKVTAIHLLGPFLESSTMRDFVDSPVSLRGEAYPKEWVDRLIQELGRLSVVPIACYSQYAVMLHRIVNGKTVPQTEIHHQPPPPEEQLANEVKGKVITPVKDRMNVYLAERTLLQAIREGDADLAAAATLEANRQVSRYRQYTGKPLEDCRIACTTFTAICTRAAIEGGFTPSKAYPIGDSYIRKINQCGSVEKIVELKNTMYMDFVSRIHQLRVNPDYSKPIQSCCDYIQMHPAEEISIDLLAQRLGYSKYYLSALFKKETGCTVGDYIKYARIERAKSLLASTNLNVEDIWEAVGFSSRSVFGKAFRAVVGMTPREYREQLLKL